MFPASSLAVTVMLKGVPAVAVEGVVMINAVRPGGLYGLTTNVCVVVLVLLLESVTVKDTVF